MKREKMNPGEQRLAAELAETRERLREAEGKLQKSEKVLRRIEDLAEPTQAEARLRHLEQRLKFHVENSPLAVIEFDAELQISRWSQAAESVFGWRAEEVLGKGMFEIPWVHLEDVPRIRQVAEHLRTGQDQRNIIPNRNYRKDGSVIHCEWYNTSLLDARGKLVSILSLVLDVTARERAEELLRSQAQHLEALVRERTAKLNETVAELHQVSYALMHDMRAPLRAMHAFAEFAEQECRDCLRPTKHECRECLHPKLREYHQRITVAANHLDRLVVDAFNYSKTLHQEVPLAPVDLDALIRDLLQTYPDLLPERAEIQIEGSLPAVLGNDAFLTQCFSSLLDNAVKFVAPGIKPRVRIWAESAQSPTRCARLGEASGAAREGVTAPPESKVQSPEAELRSPLVVKAQALGGGGDLKASAVHYRSSPAMTVRIWLEDNGIGIPKDVQPRLFGIFQKFNPQFEGTGIGLAIVRKVVERMGGRVGVESDEGRSSRFWVELNQPSPR